MKHHLPPLDSLKAFESAARHLSFSVAADELCISKGAISYQIRKLEEQVECALFKRTVRQVYLTDAGQALLQTTKSMFQELEGTLHRLHGESGQTSVSIAATTYVAARWLSPRISAFNELHPDIAVSLLHSVNSADFKLSDVDMAIQWGPCPGVLETGIPETGKPEAGKPGTAKDKRNVLEEIPMPLFPVVAPALLQKHAMDTCNNIATTSILEGPLSKVPLLCEDRQLDLWNEWFVAALPESHQSLPNPRRVISDANVRVQAAIDGQGFILADELMVSELNSGLLIQPFSQSLEGYGYSLKASSSRILSNNAKILNGWFCK